MASCSLAAGGIGVLVISQLAIWRHGEEISRIVKACSRNLWLRRNISIMKAKVKANIVQRENAAGSIEIVERIGNVGGEMAYRNRQPMALIARRRIGGVSKIGVAAMAAA
jgi:hypothetical protein